MTPLRTRFLLALGGFVALAILLPSTVGASLPGVLPLPSNPKGPVDLGVVVRDIVGGSEAAAITHAPFERVWSQASSRGRFSVPLSDLARATLLLTAIVVALVAAALVSVRTAGLAASISDPRAPPLLLQPS